jgi:hypothetical protein
MYAEISKSNVKLITKSIVRAGCPLPILALWYDFGLFLI